MWAMLPSSIYTYSSWWQDVVFWDWAGPRDGDEGIHPGEEQLCWLRVQEPGSWLGLWLTSRANPPSVKSRVEPASGGKGYCQAPGSNSVCDSSLREPLLAWAVFLRWFFLPSFMIERASEHPSSVSDTQRENSSVLHSWWVTLGAGVKILGWLW